MPARQDLNIESGIRMRETRRSTPTGAALAIVAAGLAICASAAAQQAPPGASVESLLAYARERSPAYAAARHEADAIAQRVVPAGALPDPVLRTELQDVTNAGSGAGFNLLPARVGKTRYQLMQSVPFFGKRELRREVALADSDEASRRADATWVDIAARIKVAFAQHYGVVHGLRLTSEILVLLGRLEQVAQVRYAGGLAPQQDAIRAQVEQTALRAELIAMQGMRQQTEAKINGLLSRPSNAALAAPEQLRPLPAASAFDLAAIEPRVRASSPQLLVEEARVRSAQKNRDLVVRNRYPDFTFGIAPIQTRSRLSEWELMVELNIPLQRASRRSQEHEAESMLAAAQARRDATAAQLLAELGENLSALDAARRTETLLASSLQPQAQLTLHSALAAYENGKVDFATLLDAQRQIRRAALDLLKAQTEAQVRLAEIERLLGETL